MKRIVLTFGLIAGGVLSLMMVATIPFIGSIGFDHAEVIGYTTMVLAFLLVFFGVQRYRDQLPERRISFGRAFTVGLLITVVASLCYVVTWEIIYFKLAPNFGDVYAEHMIEKARAQGATPQQLAVKTEQMTKFRELYRNPLINAAVTFIEPFPVGLLVTLVGAATLSRRRRSPAPSAAVAERAPVG